MINNHLAFAKMWNDTKSIKNLRSDRSTDVQKAEAETILKDMAARFERQPNGGTLSMWAKDIIDLGYSDLELKEVCKSIPYKFEKCPNLAQILELLRPYLPQKSVSVSDMDKYFGIVYPIAKEKFEQVFDAETREKILVAYKRDTGPYYIPDEQIMVLVVMDWIRSMKGTYQQLVAWAKKSNSMLDDPNYFLSTLKSFASNNSINVEKLYRDSVRENITTDTKEDEF